MSSPHASRSVSRGRSPTPARSPPGANGRSPSRSHSPNRSENRRTRSRSPSRGPTRSRSISSRRNTYRTRSDSRSRSRSRSPSASSAPRSSKVVIEKLTKNVNQGHLREIFGSYGDITGLEMPMNRQFMTNKGLAYVVYASPDGAESAIAHMHEAQLDGALISVSIVLPRRRFSRSPPARRPPPDRFGEPGRVRGGFGGPAGRGGDRAFGRGPPMRPSPPFRDGRSPPRRYGGGGRGGRGGGGGGYRDRYDDSRSYRPRSYTPSRSRSPPPRRRRSPSYGDRSRSPPRRGYSPGPGRGRRSPSYDSRGGRSRSRSMDRRR